MSNSGSSTIRARTAAFYDWEILGRGWQEFDYPVVLPPVFRPYEPYQESLEPIDDARHVGWLSKVAGRLLSANQPATLSIARAAAPLMELPEPRRPKPLIDWDILTPPDFDADPRRMYSWLRALSVSTEPVAITVVGSEGRIRFVVSAVEADGRRIIEQSSAHFPTLRLRRSESTLIDTWSDDHIEMAGAVEFALAREFMLPLSPPANGIGLLTPIVGVLAQLSKKDVAYFQIIFQRVSDEWNDEAIRSVHTFDGKPFFSDAEYLTTLAVKKCAEPLVAASIRICVGTQLRDTAEAVMVGLASVLDSLGARDHNELTPLLVQSIEQLVGDVLTCTTHRSGSLLSISELQQLVELPGRSIVSPLIMRSTGSTKAAPPSSTNQPFILGINDHEGDRNVVGLSVQERLKHCYVIGASGTGKSTLLLNMAEQDLSAGHGFAVLDPHGDLIDEILARVPDNRINDVILFDPADADFPIGFNVLRSSSDLEKTLLSSDLVAVFKRFSSSFGDQMETVLANAILAFVERPEGGTLLDLRQFLLNKAFRERCLKTVTDREVVEYWKREFPLLRGNPQASILTRLNGFLRPRTIRNMVAQKNSGIDMRMIMDEGKILLAKLSQGLIGEENSYILGSLLVTQISQASASRQNTSAADRREFFLYLDEFHHFITPSITTLLSGARKYGLGLTLAHQDLRQIKSRDDNLLSSVLGNAFTRLTFRVGEDDARTLAGGLSGFQAVDLQNLGTGECVGRIERPANDFNLRTIRNTRVTDSMAESRHRLIVRNTRNKYASTRADVEAILDVSYDDGAPTASSAPEEGAGADTRRQRQRKKAGEATIETVRVPGRGGAQHKYLQSLVAKLAVDCGFAADIEQRVLGGHGHIDVALKRSDISIAFEISVTTSIEHEVGNLTKCLAAGFNRVVLLCQDHDQSAVARAYLADAADSRISVVLTEQLGEYFAQFKKSAEASSPSRRARSVSSPSMGTASNARGEVQTEPSSTHGADHSKKKLLIARDAAAYMGIANQTLAKYRVHGSSPPFHKIGRQVMYDLADLNLWLQRTKRTSTSDSGDASG